jgi:nicotinic acid mononucleotide adenylyltransferase
VPDEKNPLHSEEVKSIWEAIYRGNPLVKIIIIPDIASVNYGRGVGYEVKEIKVDAATANISATEIRRQIVSGEAGWKELVDPAAHQILQHFLKK